jgi:hypothetical protein
MQGQRVEGVDSVGLDHGAEEVVRVDAGDTVVGAGVGEPADHDPGGAVHCAQLAPHHLEHAGVVDRARGVPVGGHVRLVPDLPHLDREEWAATARPEGALGAIAARRRRRERAELVTLGARVGRGIGLAGHVDKDRDERHALERGLLREVVEAGPVRVGAAAQDLVLPEAGPVHADLVGAHAAEILGTDREIGQPFRRGGHSARKPARSWAELAAWRRSRWGGASTKRRARRASRRTGRSVITAADPA